MTSKSISMSGHKNQRKKICENPPRQKMAQSLTAVGLGTGQTDAACVWISVDLSVAV